MAYTELTWLNRGGGAGRGGAGVHGAVDQCVVGGVDGLQDAQAAAHVGVHAVRADHPARRVTVQHGRRPQLLTAST